MHKNFKNKFAALAACASILGSETSAMNSNKIEVKKTQTIGTVGGARNQPKKINWKKIVTIGGLVVAGGVVLETIHSLIGGFTDSKLGKWSIGEVIKNRLKKNKQSDYGNQDVGDQFKEKDESIEKGKEINEANSKKIKKDIISKVNKKLVVGPNKFKEELKENNEEWVKFDEKVCEKSSEQYLEKFKKALNEIKKNTFTEGEERELCDLLQVVRDNKISYNDALRLGVSSNKILLILNSVVYSIIVEEEGVAIEKDNKAIANLKYENEIRYQIRIEE